MLINKLKYITKNLGNRLLNCLFWAIYKINNIYSLLKRFVIYVYSSIDIIGKKIIWILSLSILLVTTSGVVIDAWKNTVFIDIVDLPEDVVKSGFTPESMTESVIRNIQLMAGQTSNKRDYIKKLNKNNKLGAENCEGVGTSAIYIHDIASKIDFLIGRDTNDIEISIPETNLSIKNFSNYLNAFFGRSNIRLKASVIKNEASNDYVVEVRANYNSKFSHKSELTAKSINQAEDVLSLLLLKYSNPAIYASIIFTARPDEAEEGISLAINQLPEYRDISSPLTLLGFLHLGSNKEAETRLSILRAKNYFERALKINKNDYEAHIGQVLANIATANRNDKAKQLYVLNYGSDIDALDTLIKRQKYVKEAFVLKSIVYEKIGEHKKAADNFKKALNTLPNETIIRASYVNYLIDENEMDLAEKYGKSAFRDYLIKIKSTKSDKLDFNLEDQALIFAKLRLLVKTNRIEETPIYSELLEGCAINLWPRFLVDIYQDEKNSHNKSLLKEFVPSAFSSAERRGAEGYLFYSRWANFLSMAESRDEAIQKYEKALEFPGEHRWALLNISGILNDQKKYQEAEKYAKKSLLLGTIPAALNNYLKAIYYQKDYKRYLHEYAEWKNELMIQPNLDLMILSGFAECNVGNLNKSNDILKEVKNDQENFTDWQKIAVKSLNTNCLAKK